MSLHGKVCVCFKMKFPQDKYILYELPTNHRKLKKNPIVLNYFVNIQGKRRYEPLNMRNNGILGDVLFCFNSIFKLFYFGDKPIF